MAYFDLDINCIDASTALDLLTDVEQRTVAGPDILTVEEGVRVSVLTWFVVYAETDLEGKPCTPLYETLTTVVGGDVVEAHPHVTEQDAKDFHTHRVEQLRARATEHGVLASESA